MTDRGPDSVPGAGSAAGDAASRELVVAAPWPIGSAISLVVAALALTLLAGALVAATSGTGWNAGLRTLVAGAVLFALYATLLGIVWSISVTGGVRFGEAVGLRSAAGLRWYAAALGAAVLGWLFSAAFTAMLTALGVSIPREDLAVFRLLPSGPVGLAITVVLLVVVAPFAEEVVYRGVLLSALSNRWGSAVGLVGSTVVFSAAHLSWVGFVPLLVVGALFGLLFIKSRSLKVAIVAHAAYNVLGIVALLASKASGAS